MSVPFVDLREQNRVVRDLWLARAALVVDDGEFTGGAEVERFEEAFAAYVGRKYCVMVSSGLDALRLMVEACTPPGARVCVPALTFCATLDAVLQAGRVPVLADVDDHGLLPGIPQDAAVALPVHLYGQMADVSSRATVVLEDACQAHGALLNGASPGLVAAAYSFYPAKNLGGFMDGGAVVTDSSWVAGRVKLLRNHGYYGTVHLRPGWNARPAGLNAAALHLKLSHLDRWNRQRADAAALYSSLLDGVGDLRLPVELPGRRHVWHVYSVQTASRELLRFDLARAGIETRVHYDTPLHLMAYEGLGQRGEFPVAERIARQTLSLPLWPGITEAQQHEVAFAVKRWFDRRRDRAPRRERVNG